MAEYRIVVDFNGGGTNTNQGYVSQYNGESTNTSATTNTTQDNSVFNVLETGANAFSGVSAVSVVAVAMGKNIFSHELQRIGRYTGSRQAQNIANATTSIIGAMANPLGAIINMGYQYDELYYQRQWESIGIQLTKERGGVSLNRSRTED